MTSPMAKTGCAVPTYFVNQTKIEGVVDEEIWDKIILEQIRSTKSEIRAIINHKILKFKI